MKKYLIYWRYAVSNVILALVVRDGRVLEKEPELFVALDQFFWSAITVNGKYGVGGVNSQLTHLKNLM